MVFNHSLDSRYNVLRRQIKRLLRNQAPAAYPITAGEAAHLIEAAGLSAERRMFVLPGVSEAAFFVCRK